MNLPSRDEWAFSSVEPMAVWACFEHEYHREAVRCDLSGELLKRLKCRERRGVDVSLVFRRLLGADVDAAMETPWSGLPAEVRARLVKEFAAPPERPALELNFDGLKGLEEPCPRYARGADGVKLSRIQTLDESRSGLMGRLRTVPFYLPRGLSRRELVVRFDQWLRDNPEWTESAKTGRERRKWKPQEALRYLAARRLVKACGGARELADIAAADDQVVHELIQAGRAVPGEAEIGRMVRKADALVAAAAKGELRDFRMPAPVEIPKPRKK